MPRSHTPYPPEFRRQMVELVRAGRTPDELGKEFEPSSESIRNWVRQADRDEGGGDGGLTTEEHQELQRLRKEGKRGQWHCVQQWFGLFSICFKGIAQRYRIA